MPIWAPPFLPFPPALFTDDFLSRFPPAKDWSAASYCSTSIEFLAASSSYAKLIYEPSGYFSRIRSLACYHLSNISCKPSSASVLALSIRSLIYRPFSLSSTTLSLYFASISPLRICNYSKSLFFSAVSASCFLVYVSIACVNILFCF